MERYLRTEGPVVLGVQVAWEAAYAAAAHLIFGSSSFADPPKQLALFFLLRFARNSCCWYYYKMTKLFWINYLYYSSFTTYEFLRFVVMTFTVTAVHELVSGRPTDGDGWLPFPYGAATWTTKGVESWKVQDMEGYVACGSPQPGDFVQPHHRYWGWKRPPMWHMIISFDVMCTASNQAQLHEYHNYCGKLNAGLTSVVPQLLKGAKTVASASFKPTSTVDASADSTCSYKIFGVGADLAERLHTAMETGELTVGVKVDVALVDELMRVVCKHVSRDGKPITIDDCVAMHLNTGSNGPYIPVLHWDVEYGLFPEADGFNIWMLTSSDDAEGSEGNVYVADTPTLQGTDELPEWIAFSGSKSPAATRRLHDLSFPERQTHAYETLDELKMRMDYIAAKPGECVVWGKRTLHMSDPRPIIEGRTIKRKVIQIRVVLRPKDHNQTSLVFNPKHVNNFLLPGWAALYDARKEVGGKWRVPLPSTYQLLQPFHHPSRAAARLHNEAVMRERNSKAQSKAG